MAEVDGEPDSRGFPPRGAAEDRLASGPRVRPGAVDLSLLVYIGGLRYYWAVHAFDVLHDPVRRRLVELLAERGEQAAGEVGAVVQREFGISQPTVSQHLRVLRESGFAQVRNAGTRRLYAVEPAPLRELDEWLSRYRTIWENRLDQLGDTLDERHPRSNPDDRSPE